MIQAYLNKIKQYGLANSLARLGKAVLRKFGIKYEKSIFLTKDITGPIQPQKPLIPIDVKELKYRDFEQSAYMKIDPERLQLYKKRLDSSGYIALGAFHNSTLVYTCWISFENFESPINIDGRFNLMDNEALLLDAWAHPDIRGKGVHSTMNAVRLNKVYENNKNRAIVIVLKENRPALKSQLKVGFRIEKIITSKRIFIKRHIRIKNMVE